MKKVKLLLFSSLSLFIFECGNKKNSVDTSFSFKNDQIKAQYFQNERAEMVILNNENKKIDSIVYYLNDKKLFEKKDNSAISIDCSGFKLGKANVKAVVFSDGNSSEVITDFEIVSNIQPKLLKYDIVNTYDHDVESFTQGFEFFDGKLMESTGLNGESFIRKYDYKTGKTDNKVDLDSQYFGEGITVLNEKIYQLTWQSYVGFVYDAKTFKLEKKYDLDKKVEGWGITNDGKFLYQSDGTERIWKTDPTSLKMIDYIDVYSFQTKIEKLNELEWVEGKIYGNVWEKDAIAVINPSSGAVEAILDLSELRKKTSATSEDVLNGIAYNKSSKTLFVTGKNWNKMFEIKIKE